MRIFVSEYVCGGAWPDEEVPASLAKEGRAMLLALLEDAADIPEWDICTTWDRRLGEFPGQGISELVVDDPREEQASFDHLTRTSDATCVIAPELNGLLARRCQRVADLGGVSLNSSVATVSMCGDKLELARRIAESEIRTPPTQLLGPMTTAPREFPVIVKPRFGAGSHETCLVETVRQFEKLRARFADLPKYRQTIVQPFEPGIPVSVAAFFDDRGLLTETGPVVEQELSDDGRFGFLGGRIPADVACEAEIHRLVRNAAEVVPGLQGYAGFDVLVPASRPHEPLLIEINPRLTTSYVGYRALTADNLSTRVLQPHSSRQRIAWRRNGVQFTSDGSVWRVPQAVLKSG